MKKFASLLIAFVLVLALIPAMAEGEKIAVICDPVGVNAFLTQVVEKVEELAGTYGYEYRILECSDTDKWQSSYDAAVAEEYNLILGVGWQSAEYAAAKAEEADESIRFAVIDTDAGSDKVASYSYNEEQAAYLMGAMAGYAFPNETKFGYIGCFEGSGSFKYRWGFMEGVKSVVPDAQITFNYTNSYAASTTPTPTPTPTPPMSSPSSSRRRAAPTSSAAPRPATRASSTPRWSWRRRASTSTPSARIPT